MIALALPWPPSVNHYWRHLTRGPLAGRTLISEAGRRYRKAVAECVYQDPELRNYPVERTDYPLAGRLRVVIEAFPPDRRKRDIDNLLKSSIDSMTHAGVWIDDEQIDDLRIIRKSVVRGGRLEIVISVIADVCTEEVP